MAFIEKHPQALRNKVSKEVVNASKVESFRVESYNESGKGTLFRLCAYLPGQDYERLIDALTEEQEKKALDLLTSEIEEGESTVIRMVDIGDRL